MNSFLGWYSAGLKMALLGGLAFVLAAVCVAVVGGYIAAALELDRATAMWAMLGCFLLILLVGGIAWDWLKKQGA